MGTLHYCHHHPNITESRHNSAPPRVLLLIFQTNSYLLCIIILRLDMCSMYLLDVLLRPVQEKLVEMRKTLCLLSYIQSTHKCIDKFTKIIMYR